MRLLFSQGRGLMKFNVWHYTTEPPDREITVRCPGCKQLGTFTGLPEVPDLVLPRQLRWPKVYLGHRRCPNKLCNTHVFFALQKERLLVVYPTERLDFDSTKIPPPITSSLEEAITCHANRCYRAAAMMVRRSLEELCHERGVTGGNLYERINTLGNSVSVPAIMLDALHDLRLLGNDAAHIESKEYLSVGKEEVELAIEVTKVVLQLVYQHPTLIGELKARKR
jgi:hypothetical protein